MRLYGKTGKGDPCHDRRHCAPEKGSRTREERVALGYEEKAGTWPEHPAEVRLLDCDAGNCVVCRSP